MTADKPSVSVVVPVCDEEEVVTTLSERLTKVLRETGRSYELIVVDDGSKDRTLPILRQLQESCPELTVLELSRNYGQTAALAAGIDFARCDVIVAMDGDLQHDPGDIPRLLDKLDEGFDIVSGWRRVRTDSFLLRRLPSYCANAIIRMVSGIDVKDFGSGFKAYRSDIVKRIELFGELHRFIPVLAHRLGARTTEVPITVHPRQRGSSKYGLRRTLGVFQDLVFLEFYSNYLTKPIRAFGKLFLAFFGVGFSIAAGLLVAYFLGAIPSLWDRGALLIFSVFLMIVGIQFLATGVLAELLSRIHLSTSGNKIYSVRNVFTSSRSPDPDGR